MNTSVLLMEIKEKLRMNTLARSIEQQVVLNSIITIKTWKKLFRMSLLKKEYSTLLYSVDGQVNL